MNTVAKGGGQNRKAQKRRGRPAGFSPTDAIAHIGQLVETSPPFVHPSDTAVYTSDGTESFECVLCSNVLIQPVELGCSNLVCAACCCKWVEVSGEVCKIT